MGNSIPVTPVPRGSESRAVIYIESKGMLGKLAVTRNEDETLPTALDGTVPACVFSAALDRISERCHSFRGGLVTFCVALSQGLLLAWIVIGFLVSKYAINFPFFSPVALCVLGTFEILVLSGTGQMLHREESRLISDILTLLHPWRDDYGIVAKMRKSRGKMKVNDNGHEKSISCYCIVLQKMTPGLDIGTVSLSSFTDIESDDENENLEVEAVPSL